MLIKGRPLSSASHGSQLYARKKNIHVFTVREQICSGCDILCWLLTVS